MFFYASIAQFSAIDKPLSGSYNDMEGWKIGRLGDWGRAPKLLIAQIIPRDRVTPKMLRLFFQLREPLSNFTTGHFAK